MYETVRDFISKHKIFSSLKLYILVVVFAIGLFISIFIRGNMVTTAKNMAVVNKEEDILVHLSVFLEYLTANNILVDRASDEVDKELSQLSSSLGGRVLFVDSNFKIIKDSYGILTGDYLVTQVTIKSMRGETVSEYDDNSKTINVAIPYNDKVTYFNDGIEVEGSTGLLLVTLPAAPILDKVDDLYSKSRIYMILAIILSGIVAYISALYISRRIERLTKTIESVASFEEGDIYATGFSETDGIVKAFNAQRSRLKVLDDSRQEFVSNVSHELRTPITSIKVLAETLVLQDNAPIEMYRDFMQDIVEEVDRENSIITDLLALVHMERGKESLNITNVMVNNMLELIIKRITPIARENDVDIVFETGVEAYVDMDEVKMTLAITNFVENAIKYNKHPGWVKIHLEADNQMATITISDSGIGIPEEALGHIYERFYRVDKSHSREIGGTGLGLALARKIILLHRGSVAAQSTVGEGTTFTIRLPLTYIEK